MEIINNLLPDNAQAPVNSSQLSYVSNYPKIKKGKQVSKVSDNSLQENTQCAINEALALNQASNIQGKGASNISTNTCSLQKIINIQLLYDINQTTEQGS